MASRDDALLGYFEGRVVRYGRDAARALLFSPSEPVTPALISSDRHNYDPGPGDWYRVETTQDGLTFTGMAAGTEGQRRAFVNVGAFNFIVANESGLSAADNRFAVAGIGLTVLPNGRAEFLYDGVSRRWRAWLL